MKVRMVSKGRMLCDVCNKPCKTLGDYTGSRKWAVCLKCFSKADRMSYRQGRWPDDSDFAKLQEQQKIEVIE